MREIVVHTKNKEIKEQFVALFKCLNLFQSFASKLRCLELFLGFSNISPSFRFSLIFIFL